MQCRDCKYNEIPESGECRHHDLCKSCWRARGRPWIEGYVCKDCNKQSFLGSGDAYTHSLCRGCYNRLRNEKLSEIYCRHEPLARDEPAGWAKFWEDRSVFIGNLPYDHEVNDIEDWVMRSTFPGRDARLLFHARHFRGGRQGDHGVSKNIFKRFVLLDFTFARDAKFLLDFFRNNRPAFKKRFLAIHPCVIQGSWWWLGGKWHCCSDLYLCEDDDMLPEHLVDPEAHTPYSQPPQTNALPAPSSSRGSVLLNETLPTKPPSAPASSKVSTPGGQC